MSSSPSSGSLKEDSGHFSVKPLLVFLLPSLIGIGVFLIPFTYDDSINVGMGIMADWLMALLGDSLPVIAVVVFWISLILTLYVKALKPAWATGGVMHDIFDVEYKWVTLRVIGTVLATMTLLQAAPDFLGFIIADATGGEMLNNLIPVLFAFFLFAAFFLPFLVDYGFMEFIGSLVRKPFRFIFNLPGRSAIDATASWVGSGTVGVLITMQQFENGFYSRRESAVIATNFSVVSIAFSLVVINYVDLNHMFLPYYGTVIVSGIIAAIIIPRIPPLSLKPETYYEPVGRQLVEEQKYDVGIFRDSVYKAMDRAKVAPGPVQLLRNSASNVADIFFSLLPLVFAFGIMALILAEETPLFTWISYPMVPLLQLLQIPEPYAAAPATLIGFADMFLPAVLVADIESEITRFIMAALSVSQLIYMSEVGALIVKSRIPLNIRELIIIFLLRTIVTLPIITLMAYLFFF